VGTTRESSVGIDQIDKEGWRQHNYRRNYHARHLGQRTIKLNNGRTRVWPVPAKANTSHGVSERNLVSHIRRLHDMQQQLRRELSEMLNKLEQLLAKLEDRKHKRAGSKRKRSLSVYSI
jgi:septin family protein